MDDIVPAMTWPLRSALRIQIPFDVPQRVPFPAPSLLLLLIHCAFGNAGLFARVAH